MFPIGWRHQIVTMVVACQVGAERCSVNAFSRDLNTGKRTSIVLLSLVCRGRECVWVCASREYLSTIPDTCALH